ncbi:MAG: hypothetical protein H6712_08245 [Myxococcales bacterium]|nr:hypothetical protein [Myxococcales bacterium]MCB9713828.1 hypothetical protein [Myxococcales bacterium]
MRRRTRLVLLAVLAGCRPPTEAEVTPQVAEAARQADALQVSDELERLIADGRDSEDDRVFALDQIRSIPDDGTAAYAFARAAVAGRVAELRGVKAGKLVGEAEGYGLASIERDPGFRERAASRLVGSLWVMAPPRLLEQGDSEKGLELLETLAEEQPEELLNHLRLAEAYVFLGDPEPAVPHLCTVMADRASLRRDDDALLTRLLDEAADEGPIECDGEASE